MLPSIRVCARLSESHDCIFELSDEMIAGRASFKAEEEIEGLRLRLLSLKSRLAVFTHISIQGGGEGGAR